MKIDIPFLLYIYVIRLLLFKYRKYKNIEKICE